jgi:hypothetical protein
MKAIDLDSNDWTKSTEENYTCSGTGSLIGAYKRLREDGIDRQFHSVYSHERQLFQDQIINYYIEKKSGWNRPAWKQGNTHRTLPHTNTTKKRLDNSPFALFTAGAMGAGKSHTLRWLARNTNFPLSNAVFIDIDRIREHFPEMHEYRKRWAPTCGTLTHKEAGYISELIWMAALENGQSVIIDSSLRDLSWWSSVIQRIRNNNPKYSIGLLQVVAKVETIFKRQHQRAQSTGRMVPFKTLIDSIRQTPVSVVSRICCLFLLF